MQYTDAQTKMMACRQLAMEQNQKLFNQANALSCSAFDMLDRPDFDSEGFDEYLRLRGKAEALFREAIDHLGVLNKHFPAAPANLTTGGGKVTKREKEMA